MSPATKVTAAQIERAIKACASQGMEVRGLRLHADGDVTLLREVDDPAATAKVLSWVDLAGGDEAVTDPARG